MPARAVAGGLSAWASQLTEPTFQVRPIDAIAALFAVVVVTVFLCRPQSTSTRRPVMGIFVGWIASIVGYIVEEVTIRLLGSARIQHSFVSASCKVLESPMFRDSFQAFLESEHVKESCARVVQDIAETPGVAQGIHAGALNTGMIAALGVARQVPLVGRFVPPAMESKGDMYADILSPRRGAPPQAFVDIPTRARIRGLSADGVRDRGLSSASTQASSRASSDD